MAWALQFDGVNDKAIMLTPWVASGDFTVSGFADTRSVTEIFIGDNSGSLNYVANISNNTFRIKVANVQVSVTGTTRGTNTPFTFSRVGSTVSYDVDGVTGSFTSSGTFTLDTFGTYNNNSLHYGGRMYGVWTLSRVGDVRTYDFDASNHSAGQPAVTDTSAGANNATGVNFPTDGSAWVNLGGGSILITIDSLSQSQALEQITVTPTYSSTTVTVNNASQQQSIGQINLTQLNKLVINNLSHQQTVEQSLLTQHNNIAIDGLSNAQTLDSINLTQAYILTINNLSQSQTTEQVTTTTLGVVNVNNTNQQQTVEQPSLTQLGTVGLDSVNQQQTLEQILLTEHSTLTLDSLSQQQYVDPTVLTYAAKILLNSLSQPQTAQDINLSTINIVTIDNLSNQQMIDSINFGGVIVGYLAGELSVVYAYNGDIMIQNALTGDVSILTN